MNSSRATPPRLRPLPYLDYLPLDTAVDMDFDQGSPVYLPATDFGAIENEQKLDMRASDNFTDYDSPTQFHGMMTGGVLIPDDLTLQLTPSSSRRLDHQPLQSDTVERTSHSDLASIPALSPDGDMSATSHTLSTPEADQVDSRITVQRENANFFASLKAKQDAAAAADAPGIPHVLKYRTFEDSEDARTAGTLSSTTAWLNDPTFPKNGEQDRSYVLQLTQAMHDCTQYHDNDKLVIEYKRHLVGDPEAVEHAAWIVLHEAKSQHQRGGSGIKADKIPRLDFVGNFSLHWDTICDKLYRVSKTNCKKLLGAYNPLSGAVANPENALKNTLNNKKGNNKRKSRTTKKERGTPGGDLTADDIGENAPTDPSGTVVHDHVTQVNADMTSTSQVQSSPAPVASGSLSRADPQNPRKRKASDEVKFNASEVSRRKRFRAASAKSLAAALNHVEDSFDTAQSPNLPPSDYTDVSFLQNSVSDVPGNVVSPTTFPQHIPSVASARQAHESLDSQQQFEYQHPFDQQNMPNGFRSQQQFEYENSFDQHNMPYVVQAQQQLEHLEAFDQQNMPYAVQPQQQNSGSPPTWYGQPPLQPQPQLFGALRPWTDPPPQFESFESLTSGLPEIGSLLGQSYPYKGLDATE